MFYRMMIWDRHIFRNCVLALILINIVEGTKLAKEISDLLQD